MGLFSRFRKLKSRRTFKAGFRDYHSGFIQKRTPIKVRSTDSAVAPKLNRREQKQSNRFRRVVGVIALILGIGAFIYGLVFTSWFEIRTLDIQGDAQTLNEQAGVQSYLEAYLGDNLIWFSSNKHEQTLLKKYPYLQSVKIRRLPFHTLRAALITFELKANVQMNFEDGQTQFYIVNELGYISSIGNQDESLPTVVMDVTGTDIQLPKEKESAFKINEELIDPAQLDTLLATKKEFEGKFNMQVLQIQYLKRARELHLLTERQFTVWIDLTQPIDIQLAKMKKAMTKLNIYEAPLQYIDLRISGQNGEKVIYKLN